MTTPSPAAANEMLRARFSQKALYASLHTADPAGRGNSEVAGGRYVRQRVLFAAPNDGSISSSIVLEFQALPTATLTHLGYWDAPVGGNFILGTELSGRRDIQKGDSYRIPAGDATITIV